MIYNLKLIFRLNLSYKILFFIFLSSNLCTAQKEILFDVQFTDVKIGIELTDDFSLVTQAKDSLSFISILLSEVQKYQSQGYITATLDTVFRKSNTIIAKIFKGEKYEYADIRLSDNDLSIIESAGLKTVRWKGKTIDSNLFLTYADRVLTYLENNGFPFATIGLDSVQIDKGKLSAKINIQKNTFIPFDSLTYDQGLGIRKEFLERYLEIKKGESFSRKKVEEVNRRIFDLPYLKMDSSAQIRFVNKAASLQLSLKPQKASRFDFLIGVLPSSVDGERKFTITGDFTAEMHNKLGHGEYIFAKFQRLKPETQELELRFNYPYILNLPLSLDTRFELYKNANEFLEIKTDLGFVYQFNGKSNLKTSWKIKSSRLIDIDTVRILSTKKLPPKLDISFNGGGLEFRHSNLDYRFNPSKGWEFNLGATAGLKKIIRNNTIEGISNSELDFKLSYDTLDLQTFQTTLNLSTAIYAPVLKVGVIKFGLKGGLLYNEAQVFENEFYRIGGNRLLRGFDEQSIITDSYLIASAEFRLILDRNSYLSFPFIDYGITRIRVDDESIWDTAIGLGLGINFSTQAGIFNVSFASGQRLNNSFDFANTKVHFGYVSLF